MKKLFVIIFAALAFSIAVAAQTKQRVRFVRGSSSASVSGTIRGYDYRDYIVGARAGQTISAKLSAKGVFPVLTIFLPNGDNLEGATQMDEFTGELPTDGDYVVRVLMMRAQARRKNSVASYSLKISVK